MIELHDITKMANHIIHRQHGGADREVMMPAREWLLGLVVTGFFVTVGGIAGWILYTQIYVAAANDDVIAPAVPSPYQSTVVDAARDRYAARKATYNTLRGDVTAPIVRPIDSVGTTTAPVTTGTTTSQQPALDEEVVVPTELPPVPPTVVPETVPADQGSGSGVEIAP
jgi:hypothetical protein